MEKTDTSTVDETLVSVQQKELETLLSEVEEKENLEPDTEDIGVPMSSVEELPLEWLWENRIPQGMLVSITGESGTLKSFLGMDLIAHVSSGRQWPDGAICEQGYCLFAYLEDSREITSIKRLKDLGANLDFISDISEVKRNDVLLRGTSQATDLSLPTDIKRIEQAIRSKGAKLCVLDPIGSIAEKFNVNEFARRQVLAPLAAIAMRTGCTIVYINHFGKGKYNEKNVATATKGASAYREFPRVTTVVTSDEMKPKIINWQQDKINIASSMEMLSYTIAKERVGDGRERTFLRYIQSEQESVPAFIDVLKQRNTTATRKKIFECIYHMQRACNAHEIAGKTAINYATVRSDLRRALEEKLLIEESRGYYNLPIAYRKA